MLRIDAGNGIELLARHVIQARHKEAPRILIELADVTLARAAAALDGNAKLVTTSDDAPGVTTIYEGYNRIVYLGAAEDGSTRVTLERG